MASESTPRPAQRIDPEPAAAQRLRTLARAAEEADGDPPFSDQTLVDLRTAPERVRLAVVEAPTTTDPAVEARADAPANDAASAAGDAPVAAAVLVSPRGDGDAALLEAVVAPESRGGGLGRAVVEAALEGWEGPIDAWSHGDHPAARSLAESLGFTPVRELHRLLRTASQEPSLPAAQLPEGVALRSFQEGADEQELLRVNAAAFAEHPEQGGMSRSDLEERFAEDWFDAAGLLLAVEEQDPERILGFHWTKQHPGTATEPARGEVYVVGIDPQQQGRGLGRALTAAGLRHLEQRGLQEVLLYVDADNTAAFRLYESMGFRRWHVDVMFARS